jgi:DNA repair protein RadC
MKALSMQDQTGTPTELLCRMFGWNHLEAGIFLAGFGLRGLLTVTEEELESLGLPAEPVAAFQLLTEQLRQPLPLRGPLRSSRQVFEAYKDYFQERNHELFLALLLNGKNRVVREEVISQGSLTASLVHPREVFTPAVRHSAAAILCVHNHPSGDPEPSVEDRQITQRLAECGSLLGVRLLDHIILGDNRYFSFLDNGLMGQKGGFPVLQAGVD